jgi:hypothetical protein
LLLGITEVEQLAREQQQEVLRMGGINRTGFPEDGGELELIVRAGVRSKFLDVLSGRLSPWLLEELKNVFFEIVYPTPT